MRKLPTLQQWADEEFRPDNKPHINTLYRWIKDGVLIAKKRGRFYYVEGFADDLCEEQQNITRIGSKL